MDWQEFFRHFALYSLLSTLLFGGLLYKRTSHTKAARVSYSATTGRSNFLIFAIGATVAVLLLSGNVYGYLYQRTATPVSFYWLFGVVVMMLLILAWVPATVGKKHKIHGWAAWIKTYLMFAVIALLFVDSYENFSKEGNMINDWVHGLGILYVLVLSVAATYTNQRDISQKKSLHSQQLLYVLFLSAFIVRSYI